MENVTIADPPEPYKRSLAMVGVREIGGVPSPELRAEDVDLLTLTESELFDYARGLQSELRWLRETLHEAVAMLSRTNAQLGRYEKRVLALVATLQSARADVRALRARQRAMLELAPA